MKYYLILHSMMLLFHVDVHGMPTSVDATPTHNFDSCRFSNHTQLHYYCSEPYTSHPSPVTIHNLNTFEVVEELCGKYSSAGNLSI